MKKVCYLCKFYIGDVFDACVFYSERDIQTTIEFYENNPNYQGHSVEVVELSNGFRKG